MKGAVCLFEDDDSRGKWVHKHLPSWSKCFDLLVRTVRVMGTATVRSALLVANPIRIAAIQHCVVVHERCRHGVCILPLWGMSPADDQAARSLVLWYKV